MLYLEENKIIVTKYEEINSNDNVNDYSHIKQLLLDSNCVRHNCLDNNTVIIFEVFETYGGEEWVDDEGCTWDDDDRNVYEKILCLCTMELMYDIYGSNTIWSEQSHAEQMKETIEKYGSEYKVQESDVEKVPYAICDGQKINYTIVPVLVDQYMGTEDEYEEEYEEFHTRSKRYGCRCNI